jgi:hypothetical protein
MATLASPPPKLTLNSGDCSKRSNPGELKRNISSPNVTTFFTRRASFRTTRLGRRAAMKLR